MLDEVTCGNRRRARRPPALAARPGTAFGRVPHVNPLVVAAVVAALAAATAAAAWIVRARTRSARPDDHDVLTGLPARRLLARHLSAALREADRTTRRVAVLALEVGNIAYLNRLYGREVGDAVMAAVADVLRRALRREEFLARFGGPRFVVVCPDVADRAEAEARARALLDAVQRPYDFDHDRIRLAASVGVTLTDPQTSPMPDDLVLDATIALDQALDDGRGAVRTFDGISVARSAATTEHRLRAALDQGELALHYLPVVDLVDGTVVGVEALLRWDDPAHGLRHPAQFFHALNETGLILPFGHWTLRQAARQARAWAEAHPDRPLDITVNVSARQLVQHDFLEQLALTLAETGADPGHLCLEIAEGALAHEPDQLRATLREAKQHGLRIALNDFGTGHTALGHLRQFKLDQVKIDASFVVGLPHSPEDRSIVRHIVGLAHALGVEPVAEGVETAEQHAVLRDLGCDLGQGVHFAAPQPPEVIDALLVDGPAALAEPPPVVVDVRDPEVVHRPRPG